ncbi:FIG00926787: hypothetical protein [hydrothermal vent metagenome]|uniref:Cytochrome c domain-containing protein n=1 Tax=hydrothermal vent metagenome TaxID=652676 RepID=A0A3B1DUN9_9ZZZZ
MLTSQRKTLLGLSIAGLAIVGVVVWAAYAPVRKSLPQLPNNVAVDLDRTVNKVNQFFEKDWKGNHLQPAKLADDIQIFRRLSLALHGTVPSLEEIRLFEKDPRSNRLRHWVAGMLEDNRFLDYFAERLARNLVGIEDGNLILFRRDRFTEWLRTQLKEDRPYNEMVQEMIASDGLWTGVPQTNFITATIANDVLDVNKLAGRSVRAFMGQRMDCAQCHDHPFVEEWKQKDFEGIAAYYGQTNYTILGVGDQPQKKNGKPREHTVQDFKEDENGTPIEIKRVVKPAVPFHPEWLPSKGNRRALLAGWLTHPQNRRFERAIVNRIWGLLFGRPYIDPVDDLPDPPKVDHPDLLDLLGADFREHHYSLRRLIYVITASKPFQLQSHHRETSPRQIAELESRWGVFPLMRLRPEQVIGSMLQTSSIKTIDQNSHLIFRALRLIRESDFIKDYGDLGEDELGDRAGTIPQALLRMNGKLPEELLKTGPITASGRITSLSKDTQQMVENCFLVCLTRKPTEEEQIHFVTQLQGKTKDQQNQIIEDLFWALYNSPEFSWNH